MRIYVNEIKVTEDSLKCYTEQSTEGLQEAGQMLVDSDNYSFAYILDDGQSYSYLILFKKLGLCYMKIKIKRLSLMII